MLAGKGHDLGLKIIVFAHTPSFVGQFGKLPLRQVANDSAELVAGLSYIKAAGSTTRVSLIGKNASILASICSSR